MKPYQVPQGFGCVEEGLYRAAVIDRTNLPFLESLNLRTLVSLNPEAPTSTVKVFADKHKIAVAHVGIQPWRALSDWRLVSKSILQDALNYVLNSTHFPVLILDSANIFVSVLRKLQHWSYASILAEYSAFSGVRAHYKTEVFLELISVNCVEHEKAHIPRQKSLPAISFAAEDGEVSRVTYRPLTDAQMTLTLPPAAVLPAWFERQRAMWEEEEAAARTAQA